MKFATAVVATCLVCPVTAVPASPHSTGAIVNWWGEVRRGLTEGEYHASDDGRGLQAPNRAHDLRIYFEPVGVRVHSRTAVGGPRLVSLLPACLGRGDALVPITAGTVTHAGARVEIRHAGVIEWYENSARGIEQGFTLETRPPGEGPLVLELAIVGARAALHGESIVLATESGRRLLYDTLGAVDADGRIISSHFEVPEPHRVRIVVQDIDAAYPLVIDPLLTGMPDAVLESNQPDPAGFLPAAFGGVVASAGDVNGDGFDDVIVGAPGWDGGDPHEGAVFVFLGSAAGIVGSNPATAHAWIESNQFGAQLGTAACAGDVNGDGYDDIVVGAHFYSSVLPGTDLEVNGAAFVFHGSSQGITGTDPTTADAWIEADQLGSDLGLSVAGAGDVNGDGYDDIIVSAPRQGVPFPPPIPPNQGSGDGGVVLVFHGSESGITGTGRADADTVLTPYPPDQPDPNAGGIGGRVAAAGDVNNDGFADIVVSGVATTVFLGSAGGIVGTDPSNAHARIEGFGGIVSGAGDVNGDGYGDIIVGAPFHPVQNSTTQEGAAFVFLGSAAGITATLNADAHASFFGNLLAEWVGASVSGAGDVDGDGYDDVLVAARVYPGSLDSEGVGYLFRGGPAGITAQSLLDADVRLEARQSGAVVLGNNAAFSISGAGDIDNDGHADVIMGKGYYDLGQENEGAAFIYMGQQWPANPNQPPVPDAGSDLVFTDLDDDGFETVSLDGCGSFDPDGSILSVAWYEGETLLGSLPTLTTILSTTGDHTLVLTVTDDDGVTRGDPVTVRVELIDDELVFFNGFESGLSGWITGGDVQLTDDAFPDPPQARLGASGAFLRRSIDLPAGTTGMTVSFWAKASQFAPTDQLLVKVSADGGPFVTLKTFTSEDSGGGYVFYGGSAIPLGHSWFPLTASSLELEFESHLTTGLFSVDVVKVRALIGPGTVDSDGDGTPDEIDGCPNDPNKTAPGVCGCGSPDVDPDGDGIVNCDGGACGGCEHVADINCDGVVGIIDLLLLLAQWGQCDPAPASCPADLDRDGTVGITDLLAVLAGWE